MADGRNFVQKRMVEAIELAIKEGKQLPWHRPWRLDGSAPANLRSKKPYRGINPWILMAANYDCQWWVTANQCKQMGGKVLPRPDGVEKGQWGWPIVFFKPLIKKNEETGEKKVIPFWRAYNVFNAKYQCEGLEDKIPDPKTDVIDFNPIDKAEHLWDDMKSKPTVEHDGGNRAFYRPSTDGVHLPTRERFENEAAYYSTLFHELIHSTGHVTRLARKGITDTTMFGDHLYSKEELIAEMGAAFLCGEAGIDGQFDSSVAYMKGWLEKINNDVGLVVQAGAAAQKAADYVMGIEQSYNDYEEKQLNVELENSTI